MGRKPETDRLRAALERAGADGPQAVLVGGEPGIGKTALVADFARWAHAQGAGVLYGRCDEEMGAAYQPFAEALGHYVDHCQLGDLSAHVGAHGGELSRIAPQLTQRLPEAPPPRVTGSDGDRYRLFEAASALLDQACRDRLLVLVIDDLHWAAPQTLSLLRHILRSRPSSLLVVGTYRHTEVGPDHPLAATLADLRREPGVERVLLDGLDEHGVAAFVEASEDHAPEASGDALARALHARTGGNPFFVGEFLRHLAETGAVYRKEGPWSYYEDDEELGLPEGVRDVVARRLRRLSSGANRVLTIASVVGIEFDLRLLEHVDQAGDADAVLDALDEAITAHVVVELDPGRYQFAHALVRDTIYSTVTASRRARLHHRVGAALASLPGDVEPRLPALAHHFAEAATDGAATEAGDYAEAVTALAMSRRQRASTSSTPPTPGSLRFRASSVRTVPVRSTATWASSRRSSAGGTTRSSTTRRLSCSRRASGRRRCWPGPATGTAGCWWNEAGRSTRPGRGPHAYVNCDRTELGMARLATQASALL